MKPSVKVGIGCLLILLALIVGKFAYDTVELNKYQNYSSKLGSILMALNQYQSSNPITNQLYQEMTADSGEDRNKLLAQILSGHNATYNPTGTDFLQLAALKDEEVLTDPSGELYTISLSRGESKEISFEIRSAKTPMVGRSDAHQFQFVKR